MSFQVKTDFELTAFGRLFEKFGLPAPRSFDPISGGITNPAFFLDQKYVVRLNTLDRETPKFAREAHALSLLGDSGIPVPKVIFHDPLNTEFRCPVLCTQRLPGTPLLTSWQKVPVGLKFKTETRNPED